MTSSPDDYVFRRDWLDNNRINLQHYLSVQLFGYHIHPSIPTDNVNLAIADVGTGTGIWLTDLAEKFAPSVSLHAMDISFNATPPAELLPPNMTLHHWDIRSDVPEQLVGKFDLVNIRFFALVILESELPSVLERLARLLKPGGYLQWTDIDVASIRVEATRPELKSEATTHIMKLFQGNDPRFSPAWIPTLPTLFQNAGFGDIISDKKEAPPHLSISLHECGLLATEVLTRNKAGDNPKVVEMKRVLEEAAKETRDGTRLAFTRYTFVGRKLE